MKTINQLVVVAVMLVGCINRLPAQEIPAGEALAQKAANDPIREKVFRGEFKAAAHVRYHEKMSDRYARIDSFWRWTTIALGIVTFCGPLIFVMKKSVWKNRLQIGWGVVGTVTLLLSIYATFNDAADLRSQHAVLEQRWNALSLEWANLMDERDLLPRDELIARIRHLSSDQKAIESAEPPGEAGPALLQAWKEEAGVRGYTIPMKEDPQQS